MSGSEVALDTNQAVAVLNDSDDSGRWIKSFSTVYLPVTVIGELRFGALNSGRPKANMTKVDKLIAGRKVLPVDLETAGRYAELRLQLKRKGKPLPENDLWIAAICAGRDIPLATSDSHFNSIEGLSVISR